MATFTNQVQGLVSEQKQARIERQEKQRIKERQEELKKQLYYTLQGYFTYEELKPSQYQKQYLKLTSILNKSEIIDNITRNQDEVYYLDLQYNNILNKVYNEFKGVYTMQKQLEKEQEKARKEAEKNNKKQQTLKDKLLKNKSEKMWFNILRVILFIFLVILKILIIIFLMPLAILFGFIWYK